MLQLALTIIIFLIIVIPVGRYMYHIATWNHTLADPVFDVWTASFTKSAA